MVAHFEEVQMWDVIEAIYELLILGFKSGDAKVMIMMIMVILATISLGLCLLITLRVWRHESPLLWKLLQVTAGALCLLVWSSVPWMLLDRRVTEILWYFVVPATLLFAVSVRAARDAARHA